MPQDALSSQEALQHIQGMRYFLLDRDGSLTLPTEHFFLWSVISALLITLLPMLFKSSTDVSMLAYILMMLFGLLSFGGWLLTRLIVRDNRKQERGWGQSQKLMLKISFLNIFFAALMTLVLGTFLNGLLINCIWMFVLGITYIILGFFGRKLLAHYGTALVSIAFIAIIMAYIYLLSAGSELAAFNHYLNRIQQFDTLLGLFCISGGHLVLGIYFLRQQHV